jgi:hypothetical protein
VAESASGAEQVAARFTPNATVSESAAVSDVNAAAARFVATLLESATAADSMVGGKLWEVIDDTQTANWQNINNVQSSGWTVINTQ